MSKLFPWSVCRVLWVCLWEDCFWAWMQGEPRLACHGLSLLGLFCSCSVWCWTSGFPYAHFFPCIGIKVKVVIGLFSPFSEWEGLAFPHKGIGTEIVGWLQEGRFFDWQCLLWSLPGNHQSLFRGEVQTINLVPPLLGYFLEESERVTGRCCFRVCYAARILHGGVIIETKQLLLTGLTVLIAFVHLWELSKTSRVFVWKLYIVACSNMKKGKMATMPEVLLKYRRMKQAI